MFKKILASTLSSLLLIACTTQTPTTTQTPPPDTTGQGPWNGSLYEATSTDGLTFTGKTLVQTRAGVPNLLKLQNGVLVLVYQYFSSEDSSLFDTIVYSTSTDSGKTWSNLAPIDLEELPTPVDANKKPMDPTLVQLEDGRLRLYFTYHAQGNKTAALYEATATSDDPASAFTVESTPALLISGANLLDPSVTFFNGLWHHYSWQDGSDNNYHSTSTDGVTFTLQDDVNLPMDFLGEVIPFGDGLRFYGTSKGITSAYSADGSTWTIDKENLAPGADPAVQQLDDGSYLMVYTSMNFNQ